MKVTINIPQPSQCRVIPCASEHLNCRAGDVTEIDGVGRVADFYVYEKGDIMPRGLFLIAIGKEFANIWQYYPNSDKIYFFICLP
jgi:hypothetical protein